MPIRTVLMTAGILFATTAAAAEDHWRLTLADVPQAIAILDAKPIEVKTVHTVPIPFAQVTRLISADDALIIVQAAYTNLVPPGQEAEFKIIPHPDIANAYIYVSRQGVRTDMREVLREVDADGWLAAAYVVESTRFFGPFAAVVCIRGQATNQDESLCEANIYAYPRRRVSRFFIRHLGLVERFFNKKTAEMKTLFTEVVAEACRPGGLLDQHAKPTGEPPTPAATPPPPPPVGQDQQPQSTIPPA